MNNSQDHRRTTLLGVSGGLLILSLLLAGCGGRG